MMSIPKRINWNKIERAAIYVTLVAYLLLQLLDTLPLPLAKSLSSSLSSPVLGFALIGAIHYLIRVVEEASRPKELDVFRASFPAAFQDWLRPFDSSVDLRIAAFTSTLFYTFVQSHSINVRRLRLLLLVEDLVPRADVHDSAPFCSNIPFDLNETVRQWRALQSAGQIGELAVRRITARTAFYVGIADSQRVIMGLLWPNPTYQNLTVKDAVVFSQESVPETVRHLHAWFEEMWNVAEEVDI